MYNAAEDLPIWGSTLTPKGIGTLVYLQDELAKVLIKKEIHCFSAKELISCRKEWLDKNLPEIKVHEEELEHAKQLAAEEIWKSLDEYFQKLEEVDIKNHAKVLWSVFAILVKGDIYMFKDPENPYFRESVARKLEGILTKKLNDPLFTIQAYSKQTPEWPKKYRKIQNDMPLMPEDGVKVILGKFLNELLLADSLDAEKLEEWPYKTLVKYGNMATKWLAIYNSVENVKLRLKVVMEMAKGRIEKR